MNEATGAEKPRLTRFQRGAGKLEFLPNPRATPRGEAARAFINRAYRCTQAIQLPKDDPELAQFAAEARDSAILFLMELSRDLDRWSPADLYRNMFLLSCEMLSLAGVFPGCVHKNELYQLSVDGRQIWFEEGKSPIAMDVAAQAQPEPATEAKSPLGEQSE